MILEYSMNPDNRHKPVPDPRSARPDENIVERTARRIIPPGTDVNDEDLEDPGRMTPDAPPTDNRS